MSDKTEHTLKIKISDRIEWIDKRCGLSEIQKDYVSAQMKEAVRDALRQANDQLETTAPELYQGVRGRFSDDEVREIALQMRNEAVTGLYKEERWSMQKRLSKIMDRWNLR